MQLGIFAKTFTRTSFEEVLDAVCLYGFTAAQFNMSCAGLKPMPESIPDALPERIAIAFKERKLKMSAVSGTFNMIHPDKKVRQEGLKSLALLIQNAKAMGTFNITLCTGTCDAQDMWRHHPDNNTREAWMELCKTMGQALALAESADVNLLVEPELANVINTAAKASQLITEMKSSHLKIVFDPANLFEVFSQSEIENVLDEGLDLLGEHIEIVHAKDRSVDGSFTVAGLGVLPYPYFLKKLKAVSFNGDIITHGLSESEAASCNKFLRQQLSLLQ